MNCKQVSMCNKCNYLAKWLPSRSLSMTCCAWCHSCRCLRRRGSTMRSCHCSLNKRMIFYVSYYFRLPFLSFTHVIIQMSIIHDGINIKFTHTDSPSKEFLFHLRYHISLEFKVFSSEHLRKSANTWDNHIIHLKGTTDSTINFQICSMFCS